MALPLASGVRPHDEHAMHHIDAKRSTTMTRPTTHRDRTDLHPTRRTVLSGGAAAAGLAAVGSAGTAPAHAQEPPPRAVPPGAQAEGSVPGSTVTRMGNVTGPGVTTKFDLERTDIGIPVTTPSGRTYVVFGDSFSGWDNTEAWRSPTALHAEPDQDPSRLLEWSGPVGGERAVQLLPPYRGDDSEVTSKLPSDVLTVRSEEHTSELQSRGHLVCRLLLEKKNKTHIPP